MSEKLEATTLTIAGRTVGYHLDLEDERWATSEDHLGGLQAYFTITIDGQDGLSLFLQNNGDGWCIFRTTPRGGTKRMKS